jgi:hypothetical protein
VAEWHSYGGEGSTHLQYLAVQPYALLFVEGASLSPKYLCVQTLV